MLLCICKGDWGGGFHFITISRSWYSDWLSEIVVYTVTDIIWVWIAEVPLYMFNEYQMVLIQKCIELQYSALQN